MRRVDVAGVERRVHRSRHAVGLGESELLDDLFRVRLLGDVNPACGRVVADLEAQVVLPALGEREPVSKPRRDVICDLADANDENVVDVNQDEDAARDGPGQAKAEEAAVSRVLSEVELVDEVRAERVEPNFPAVRCAVDVLLDAEQVLAGLEGKVPGVAGEQVVAEARREVEVVCALRCCEHVRLRDVELPDLPPVLGGQREHDEDRARQARWRGGFGRPFLAAAVGHPAGFP
mmetsp:Transcript_17111/g.59026  ORF Transcript_17111/g.59026 Transcript_17111/m.59026 type:complete len:234 (+) Transcript_17111:958-1659(+)